MKANSASVLSAKAERDYSRAAGEVVIVAPQVNQFETSIGK